VVVNLSGVTFIDSAALSALVSGLKRCRMGKGELYLCCLQQPVRVIFELTRLNRAFTIFEEEAIAVAMLAERAVV
jgi:anti-sigma B factor antagonist